MAYIAKTAFEVKVSNHEFDAVANITGVFENGSQTAEICSAGFLCTRKELTVCEGYDKVGPSDGQVTLNNGNTWKMIAATDGAVTATPIYACNTFGVNEVTDPVTGAIYKVGSNTLGLPIPAGKPGTFTQIHFDGSHIYRFGIGNLNGAISTNKFFTIADGLLVPTASAPTKAGQPYFQLVGTGNFTVGAYNGETYYDVLAMTGVAGA